MCRTLTASAGTSPRKSLTGSATEIGLGHTYATGAAVKGLLSPEPEFEAAVKSPEAHGKLGQELDPNPEPEVKAAVDPELEAILK